MARAVVFAVALCSLAIVSSGLLVHASSQSKLKSRLNLAMKSATRAKHEATRSEILSLDRETDSGDSLSGDFTDTKDWSAFLNVSHNGHPTQSREDATSEKVKEDADLDVDISDSFAQFEQGDKIDQQMIDSQNSYEPL